MGKLFVVIKREYLERVRTRWFVIVTVFGPIFFGSIMILPQYLAFKGMKDAGVPSVRILDATGTGLGARVADKLTGGPMSGPSLTHVITLQPNEVAAAETTATKAVMAKEMQGYLVLDSATLSNGTVRYAGRNASSLGQTEAISTGIKSALLSQRLEKAGLDPLKVDALTKIRVNMSTEKIDEKGRGGSGMANAIFGFAIAFLLYFSIIFYGQNILAGVLEEKSTRVAEVVLSSVSPDVLLAGKVIGVGAVGLTQQIVWLGSTAALWNFRSGIMAKLGMPVFTMTFPSVSVGSMLILLAFFILGYAFYASLFAAVGAMSGSPEEARQAAQPVIMLLVAAIIFAQPVLLNPTSTLAQVVSILPFSAPIIMPLRMSATQVPWYELGGSLLGVFLACVIAIWLSARIYRVGLLMTGKRPNLAELMRWIRYA
jgi:ABC-2 type transport system permease protein